MFISFLSSTYVTISTVNIELSLKRGTQKTRQISSTLHFNKMLFWDDGGACSLPAKKYLFFKNRSDICSGNGMQSRPAQHTNMECHQGGMVFKRHDFLALVNHTPRSCQKHTRINHCISFHWHHQVKKERRSPEICVAFWVTGTVEDVCNSPISKRDY